MSDDSGVDDAVSVPAAPPPPPLVTAGAMLRQAREASGLHIAALAVSMKVPVAKLEALETDRFDLLPDAVFARALASGVCRALKIDARQVLDKLPQSVKPTLNHNERGIDAPFRSPADGPGPSLLDQLSWPVVAVGGLMIAAAVVYFYPHARMESVTGSLSQESAPVERQAQPQVMQSPEAPPSGTVVETPTPQPQPALVPVTAKALAPVAAASKPVQPPAVLPANPVPLAHAASAPVAPLPQSRASQALAAAKPASAPVVAPAVPAPVASQPLPFVAASGMLVLKARVPSWVSVVDARGNSVLNKVLAAGEVAAANGAAPLRVTVGKADATEVLVRGKAFDLAPVSRENVARFEVK